MQHGDLSALQIKRLYEELIRQITSLMSGLVFSPDEPFSFLKNAKINQLLNQFLAEISQKMRISIERSTIQAWELSVLNNQKFFEPYLNSGLLNAEQILHYNNRNIEALQSFLNRKTNGLNLSQRIWNLNSQFKTELEMSLDIGLSQGKPAQEIALDILNYMHQPNALLQKVGKFRGSLHLSKMVDKMKQADPVLGSSYNKAIRLARTEVNMAYRASDLEKYRQMDFVLGYEIKRSNHPFGCPVCESLKGKYPKDFQFVGWHPNCRCYTIPILQKLEDFLEEKSTENEYITDVPDNFKQWVKDNTQRIQTAPSVPYWWKDNKKYVSLQKNTPFELNEETIKKLKDRGFDFVAISDTKETFNQYFKGFDLLELDDSLNKIAIKNGFNFNEKNIIFVYENVISIEFTDKEKGILLKRDFFGEDKGNEVYHKLFQLPKEFQNRDIGKDILKTFYKQYQNSNFKKIKLDANLDVGGYAWAKYGFQPIFPERILTTIFRKIDHLFDKGEITKQELLDFQKIELLYNKENKFDMNDFSKRSYAKKVLLGTSWGGVLDLTNKEQLKIFENYLNRKK